MKTASTVEKTPPATNQWLLARAATNVWSARGTKSSTNTSNPMADVSKTVGKRVSKANPAVQPAKAI